jgi:antitoxin component of MazEF toxin-antitoxin module
MKCYPSSLNLTMQLDLHDQRTVKLTLHNRQEIVIRDVL